MKVLVLVLDHEVLVLVSVLKKKYCSFQDFCCQCIGGGSYWGHFLALVGRSYAWPAHF